MAAALTLAVAATLGQPVAMAQDAQPRLQISPAPPAAAEPAVSQQEAVPAEDNFVVDVGTRIPLSMVNSVSTKHSQEGDRVYLETTFPVAVDGRIVIPAGSYVMGTISAMQRPGKIKGRGEFYLRFDSLMLPNGVTRNFQASVSGLDGRAAEGLDKDEGVITSEGNKSGDLRTVADTTLTGASLGGLAGIGTNPGMGLGIGAAAGLATGLMSVLLSRGPDAVLAKGTTVEMVLDRQITYLPEELDFSGAPPRYSQGGGGPMPSVKSQGSTRRFP